MQIVDIHINQRSICINADFCFWRAILSPISRLFFSRSISSFFASSSLSFCFCCHFLSSLIRNSDN